MTQIKQLHALSLRTGTDQVRIVIEKLLQIPNITYAKAVFDQIASPSVFLYNKLIQSYTSRKQPQKCLCLYHRMRIHGCPLNSHSFMFLFAAFATLPNLLPGCVLHAHFVKSGFESDSFATTALVGMYAEQCALKYARQMFDEMRTRDVPTWNAMISGYARCGDMKGAVELFELMPARNLISWTAMISGFSQNGNYSKALSMFASMERDENLRPNEVTIASVLPACANLGALEVGQRIEGYARENGFFGNLFVSNAVLEMYARCGKIDAARKVFDEMGSRRNLCSWNSMIQGLATHGKYGEALDLYDQMLRDGTKPDDVTFVGLLLSCVHGGLIAKGREIFESMNQNHNITPKLEHYGCMVDLLGRAGELKEAYDLIQNMPMKPDSVVWGALLGACSFHADAEIGEKAAEALFQLDPRNPGNYIIMSNIYAANGKWDGVARLRRMMRRGGVTKAAGYSFLEENGQVHKFIVDDKSHRRRDEIYEVLDEISRKMKGDQTPVESADEELQLSLWE